LRDGVGEQRGGIFEPPDRGDRCKGKRMTAYMLFALLAALSVRCLAWGVSRPDRLYQFPTLFGAAWVFYVVPQAFGAVNFPEKYPDWLRADGALELALLMCIFCVQAGWSGYHWGGNRRRSAAMSTALYSDVRLFATACVLYAIGFYGAYLLASLMGGFVEQFTGGGHYDLEWAGLPVRYVFFAQLIYPALAIAWIAYLARPSWPRACFIILFSLYPLATTIFLGRRAATAFLLGIIFVGLYLVRRWTPPRPVVLAGFLAMAVFVVVAPQYRTITQFGFEADEIRRIDVKTSLEDVISGRDYSEFDALVGIVGVLSQERSFGFGSGFYTATIAQIVPRQLVGENFKNTLFIDVWGDLQATAVRLDLPYGSNPTGVGNAFADFWFVGALLYFFAAAAVRRVWDAAVESGSMGARMWYLVLVPMIPSSVVGSIFVIPGQIIACLIFLFPILWFARNPQRAARFVAP
jgi:hypothetical protein